MRMPKKNEHHFVPRFYIKRFSVDQRRINIFHLGHGRTFLGASIRGECKAHKLYGWDERIEDALMDLEGVTAGLLRQIDATDKVPMLGQSDYQMLLMFLLLQRGRTIEAANSNDTMTDFYFKVLAEEKAKKDGIDLSLVKVANEYGVALPLKIAAEISVSIRHLDVHILSNPTPLPYVFSDNPVALHNHYCEGIYHRGVLGWGSLGIQAFWPISSTKVLLFYDRRVYRVGTTRKSTVSLLSRSEVAQINALQVANATEKLYFEHKESAADIQRLVEMYSNVRNYERYAAILTEAVPDGSGHMSQIMHNFERMCPLKTSIDAIQLRKDARKVPLQSRNNSIRNWAKAGYPQRHGDVIRYPITNSAA